MRSETRSGAYGRYQFGSVAPGRWWLGPAAQHESAAAAGEGRFAPLVEVVLIADGDRNAEHDVIVHQALFIHGKVVDAEGKPVSTRVQVEAHQGQASWTDQSRLDGTFTAGPLANGDFLVHAFATGSNAASERVSARAGATGVLLSLQPGAAVTATIVDDASGEILRGELYFSRRGGHAADRHVNSSSTPTSLRFDGLLSGVYDITATAAGDRVGIVRGVALAAGASVDIVVRVAAGPRLMVRLSGSASWGVIVVRSQEAEIARNVVERGGIRPLTVVPGRLTIDFTPVSTEVTERREIDAPLSGDVQVSFRDGD